MRLVADIQALQNTRAPERGIPTYVGNLAREIVKRPDLLHSLSLNPGRPFPIDLNPDILNSGRLNWGSAAMLREAVSQGPLVYWIMSAFERDVNFDTLMPRRIVTECGRIVVTLYDLIPMIFPERFFPRGSPESQADRLHFDSAIELVKMADLVLAISVHTGQDAMLQLGIPRDRIAVVGTGVSEFFNADEGLDSDKRLLRDALPLLNTRFIFTVLGEDPRKNAGALIEAYSLLPRELQREYALIVAGRYSEYAIESLRNAAAPKLRDRIYFAGDLTRSALRAFYRSASLFAFPSLYEGFGLPVAEAIECGCPVICANNSSLPELVEGEYALFNGSDPEDISACLLRALRDDATQTRLRAYGYGKRNTLRWNQVAAKCFRAFERFSTSRPYSPRTTRMAVALVGPFPPEKTGIADVNRRFAAALSKVADVYIFYTGRCDLSALLETEPVECLPVALLGEAFSPYYLDGVIYVVGNSHHHLETVDKVLQYPGILWLHDTHVAELFRVYYQRRESDGSGLRDAAERVYGDRSPPWDANLSERMLQRWGVHLTHSLVEASRCVIVSSFHSLQMLTMDQPPLAPMPPVHIMPLPTSVVGTTGRATAPQPKRKCIIATFGFVGDGKEPELVIDAVALLPDELQAELVFVGEANPFCAATLYDRAGAAGLSGRMRITGFVSQSEWARYLSNSHCAVQLRTISNGESSGAVADCLSAGLPVVTNLLSSYNMPEDALVFVPSDVSASALSDALARVLSNRQEWLRLHEGALQYASQHAPEIAANRMLEIVTNLSSTHKAHNFTGIAQKQVTVGPQDRSKSRNSA